MRKEIDINKWERKEHSQFYCASHSVIRFASLLANNIPLSQRENNTLP